MHADSRGNRYEALKPIHQAVGARFGEGEQDVATSLTLRHDHGTPYTSRVFQAQPSTARPPCGSLIIIHQ
ncbi:MAG: hypothetical protein AAFZ65_05310 [Planctomycetota bacterium]